MRINLVFQHLELIQRLLLLDDSHLLLHLRTLQAIEEYLYLQNDNPVPRHYRQGVSQDMPEISMPAHQQEVQDVRQQNSQCSGQHNIHQNPHRIVALFQSFIYQVDNPKVDEPQPYAQRKIQKELHHDIRIPRLTADDVINAPYDKQRDRNRQYKKEYVSLMPHNL